MLEDENENAFISQWKRESNKNRSEILHIRVTEVIQPVVPLIKFLVKISCPSLLYISSISSMVFLWKPRKEAMMAPVLTPQMKSNIW